MEYFNLGNSLAIADALKRRDLQADEEYRQQGLRDLFARSGDKMPSPAELGQFDPELGLKATQYQQMSDARNAEMQNNKTAALVNAHKGFKDAATQLKAFADKAGAPMSPEWQSAFMTGYKQMLPLFASFNQTLGLPPPDPSKPIDYNAFMSIVGKTPEEEEKAKINMEAEKAGAIEKAKQNAAAPFVEQENKAKQAIEEQKQAREYQQKIKLDQQKSDYDAYQAGLKKAYEDQPAAQSALDSRDGLQKIVDENIGKIIQKDDKGNIQLKPEYSNVLGWANKLWNPTENLPGGKVPELKSIMENISGQSFLTAYQGFLKGSGQITEIEGQKATQALSTLQNYDSLSPQEIARQIQIFLDANNRIMEKLQERASGYAVRKYQEAFKPSEIGGGNVPSSNSMAPAKTEQFTPQKMDEILEQIRSRKISKDQFYELTQAHPEIKAYIKSGH